MNGDDEPELIDPNSDQQRHRYLWRLRGSYPDQTQSIDDAELNRLVREGLLLCAPLQISTPEDVTRFLALSFLVTKEQRSSTFIRNVMQLVLEQTDYSARRRLNFLHRHIVGRPAPDSDPDFGPWFVTIPPAGDQG